MQTPETLIRFDRLRERLIQGGVARRHVRRTLAELHDHYDDALDDGLAQGLSREAAAEAAWQRLGSEDEIVGNVLARPELQSLPARYPRAVFGAGPMVLWFFATLLSGFLIVGALKGLQYIGLLPPPRTSIEPLWLQSLMTAVIYFYMRILPVIIAATMAIAAARHGLALHWALAGGISVAALSAFSTFSLKFPTILGQGGELSLGFGLRAEELPGALALIAAYAMLILAAACLGHLRRTKRTV